LQPYRRRRKIEKRSSSSLSAIRSRLGALPVPPSSLPPGSREHVADGDDDEYDYIKNKPTEGAYFEVGEYI